MNSLSKYDVMNLKSYKFSEIISDFIKKYQLSFTKKKKRETIKILLDKLLLDAHIIFEIKKDLNKYFTKDDMDIDMSNFLENLEFTSKKLERLLLINLLLDELEFEIIIDLILKQATPNQFYLCIYEMLSDEQKVIINFMMSENYDFNLLPMEYKNIILKNHTEFIDMNINIYANTFETNKTKILKGIKLYNEKVDIDLFKEINLYQLTKKKIKD